VVYVLLGMLCWRWYHEKPRRYHVLIGLSIFLNAWVCLNDTCIYIVNVVKFEGEP